MFQLFWNFTFVQQPCFLMKSDKWGIWDAYNFCSSNLLKLFNLLRRHFETDEIEYLKDCFRYQLSLIRKLRHKDLSNFLLILCSMLAVESMSDMSGYCIFLTPVYKMCLLLIFLCEKVGGGTRFSLPILHKHLKYSPLKKYQHVFVVFWIPRFYSI